VVWSIALALVGAGSPPESPAQAATARATVTITPAALALFERDWVLMNWALKYFDVNHDILLQPDEANAAAQAFRKIADLNRDGRVSPDEYRAARAAILARD
jgi:hypothetical protein